MPDPITPVEIETNENVAPNIDSELDDALNKYTSSIRESNSEPSKEKIDKSIQETKVEEKSISESPKQEVKKEHPKSQEIEKPTLTSDEIERLDPKEKGAWGAIKNANRKAHGMIQDRDSEIAKLKSVIADKSSSTQKELETIRAEKAELEKYRAMVDIQSDPEFISKYDKPIENLVSEIKSFLKQRNVTDETLEKIDFNSRSLLSQIIGFVDKEEGELSASELRGKIRDYLDLNNKRSQTLEEQKKNYKETLEKRKQESFAKQSESEGRMLKHAELKSTEKDKDGKPLIPFLNKVEPKENSTQAEIDQINNHNHLVDVMGKKLQSVLAMKEPEHHAEIAIAAVASHYLMAQLKATNEELRKAKEELQKMAAITTEAPSRKSNNPTGRNGSSEPVDVDSALSTYMSRKR